MSVRRDIIGAMSLAPYRDVLGLPGVRKLMVVALLARVPVTMAAIVLTLHVVLTLDRGYGAAGLAAALATVGTAVGAPLLGRAVDRWGLRPVLLGTTVAQASCWAAVPFLPYALLLLATTVAGLLMLPVFSVVRQALAAMVPEDRRRPAFSLDSMSVELSYMAGPILAVLVATQVSTVAALLLVGVGTVASGVLLWAQNPPVRSAGHVAAARPPLRSWLRPAFVATLLATSAAAIVLAGSDVAIVAVLEQAGDVSKVGIVVALWGAASLMGGFVFGTLSRPVSSTTLALLVGVTTIPVGLLGVSWWTLALALLAAGALTAPTLATVADEISRLVPEDVRGVAMGVQSSALTAGFAIGAPLSGTVVDAASPAWAFAACGVAGVALAVASLVLRRLDRARAARTGPAATPHDAAATTSAIS